MANATRNKAQAAPAIAAAARQYGRPVLTHLNFALKTSRLYSFAHSNVLTALKELENVVQGFLRATSAPLHLLGADGCVFVNEVRLRPDFGSSQSFQFVLDLLKQNEIAEITFQPGVEQEELEALVRLFNGHRPPSEGAWQAFLAAASEVKLTKISFTRVGERVVNFVDNHNGRVLTLGIYFKAIEHVDNLQQALLTGKPLFLRQLKHMIFSLVDLAWAGEHLILGLANIRGQGKEPGSNHAVNVSILSIALGAKLGLPKRLLGDLGMAAVLHDLGKALLPTHLRGLGIRDVPPEESETFLAHTHSGMEALLSENMADSSVRGVNVALLHHYRYDRTGYPRLLSSREQDLFTRIVAVADHYENVTTERPGKPAVQGEQAMRLLLEGAGTEFDPLVIKAFVNLMGLYPVGCMVRLESGALATVVAPPENPRFPDRPTVRLLADASGTAAEALVHLLDRAASGAFLDGIAHLFQREEVQLDLEEYLTVL